MVVALYTYTGAVLRSTVDGGTWNLFFERIHGTLMIGYIGDRFLEIASSLGILLAVTGNYLVLPRKVGGTRAILIPDLAAPGRG